VKNTCLCQKVHLSYSARNR